MGKYLIKASVDKFDELNDVEVILGEYDGYTSILPDEELKKEYANTRREWLESPIVMNIRKFKIAKAKMIERGLMAPQNDNIEKGSEMYY